MANSTRARSGAKSRPPKYPLWHHTTGQWGKKIRGRYYYFGKDQDKALAEYTRVRPYLEAGKLPPPADGKAITTLDLVNVWLTHQKHRLELGEIAHRTWSTGYESCKRLLSHFGKAIAVEQITPNDLLAYRRKLAETLGPTALGNEVTRTRSILTFAFQNGLIERPLRIGDFKVPGKSAARRQRAQRGSRMFERVDLLTLLAAAPLQLRTMILLGVNAGLGNADCARLPISAINLDTGWMDFPRPKTGVGRKCWLWPESVDAIRAVLAKRKRPAEARHADILFLDDRGAAMKVDTKTNTVGRLFRELLRETGIYREGLSFYSLRHVTQTIGDEVGDYLATKRIMGHADNPISDQYRERFQDERLKRVAEHVRAWLFGSEGGV